MNVPKSEGRSRVSGSCSSRRSSTRRAAGYRSSRRGVPPNVLRTTGDGPYKILEGRQTGCSSLLERRDGAPGSGRWHLRFSSVLRRHGTRPLRRPGPTERGTSHYGEGRDLSLNPVRSDGRTFWPVHVQTPTRVCPSVGPSLFDT